MLVLITVLLICTNYTTMRRLLAPPHPVDLTAILLVLSRIAVRHGDERRESARIRTSVRRIAGQRVNGAHCLRGQVCIALPFFLVFEWDTVYASSPDKMVEILIQVCACVPWPTAALCMKRPC